MGNKKEGKTSQDKKGKKAPRPPKPVVVKTNLIGDPSIEELAGAKQVVLWMDVQGYGRIKVESSSPGVYRSIAADPNAATAAEAGAGEYCQQHGEQLSALYGRLI